jgi:multicomponent Na+:H+ antiporter subunit E
MRRLIFPVAWLTLVWMALWESFTFANLVGGLLVSFVVMVLMPLRRPGHQVGFRPLAALRLVAFFVWKLIQASVIVAWEVATPRDGTRPAVVSVPLTSRTPFITTAVANMVSLTPGTLTIEVAPEEMTIFIHVLHFRSKEATREDVRTLERLSLAAYPPTQESP